MEAELDTCKARLRAVEAQLLEVLEEKLRLRQEVEAWEVGWGDVWAWEEWGCGWASSDPALPPQEDMQQLVAKLVQSQLQSEARGALGAHGDAGATRSLRAQLPQGRQGRWW